MIASASNSIIYEIGKNVVEGNMSTLHLSSDDINCISTYCNNPIFSKIVTLPSQKSVKKAVTKKKKRVD